MFPVWLFVSGIVIAGAEIGKVKKYYLLMTIYKYCIVILIVEICVTAENSAKFKLLIFNSITNNINKQFKLNCCILRTTNIATHNLFKVS